MSHHNFFYRNAGWIKSTTIKHTKNRSSKKQICLFQRREWWITGLYHDTWFMFSANISSVFRNQSGTHATTGYDERLWQYLRRPSGHRSTGSIQQQADKSSVSGPKHRLNTGYFTTFNHCPIANTIADYKTQFLVGNGHSKRGERTHIKHLAGEKRQAGLREDPEMIVAEVRSHNEATRVIVESQHWPETPRGTKGRLAASSRETTQPLGLTWLIASPWLWLRLAMKWS